MRYSNHQGYKRVGEIRVQFATATNEDEFGSWPHAPAPLLAPRAGLEPATLRLTAARSTIELPRNGLLTQRLAAEPNPPQVAVLRLGARFRLVFDAHQALGFSKQDRQDPNDDGKYAKFLDHLMCPWVTDCKEIRRE